MTRLLRNSSWIIFLIEMYLYVAAFQTGLEMSIPRLGILKCIMIKCKSYFGSLTHYPGDMPSLPERLRCRDAFSDWL